MIVLIPDIVTGANITASNVDLETEWAAGTFSYAQQTRVGDDLYEVVQINGTDQEPVAGAAANPPTWRVAGKINRLRAHDHISQTGVASPIDTVTTRNESIEYTIDGKNKFTQIDFVNLTAASVHVLVSDPIAGIIYDQTQQLRRREEISGSPFAWSFSGAREKTTASFKGIPLSSSPTISITVTGGGEVAIGAILIGRPRKVGVTLYAPEIDDLSYSRIEIDPDEEKTILRRPSSRRGRFPIQVKRGQEESAFRIFSLIEAVACLFSADVPGASVYGFKERATTAYDGPNHTTISFTAKGLS